MIIKGESAATIGKDGKLSNARLREQATEDVDDYYFRMQTRAELLAQAYQFPISIDYYRKDLKTRRKRSGVESNFSLSLLCN